MLIILFSLLLYFPVLLGWGKIGDYLLGRKEQTLSLRMISGIALLTVIFSLVSFFTGLGLWVEVVIVVLGVFLFSMGNTPISLFRVLTNRFLLLSIVSVVFLGSFIPYIHDDFLYYTPTIRWLREVGMVRGIANLDLLYGQMSFWHIFQAGFSSITDTFHRVNVFISIIYLLYIWERKAWIHLIFVPFFSLYIHSPSPDLPVMIFSLIILNEVLSKTSDFSWLLGISIFLFTIKPTMIWTPIFIVIILILRKEWRLNWSFSALILALFLFKNIWCFGYPFFPMAVFDFGFSWQPNPKELSISAENALLKTYDMQYTYAEIQQFSAMDFVINWLTIDGIKRKINTLFILLLMGFTIFVALKKRMDFWALWISIILKSVLVLLFSAQFRFFIDVFFVVFIVGFYRTNWEKTSKRIFVVGIVIFIGIFSFPSILQNTVSSFRLSNYMLGFQLKQFVKPLKYDTANVIKNKIGNLEFYMPIEDHFVYESPLPCIMRFQVENNLKLGVFPQLRGDTLKDGFIWRKLSEAEKKELRKYLKK